MHLEGGRGGGYSQTHVGMLMKGGWSQDVGEFHHDKGLGNWLGL